MPRKKKAETTPEPVDDPAPAVRPKRAWSSYNQFVHDHYSDADVQAAKVRDRLKIIGRLWQEHKKNMTE